MSEADNFASQEIGRVSKKLKLNVMLKFQCNAERLLVDDHMAAAEIKIIRCICANTRRYRNINKNIF